MPATPASVSLRLADARGGGDLELRFRTDAGLTAADWPGPGPLVVDGRRWPPGTPLVDCGLVDGATVGEADHADELVVVAGPLPPAAVRLDGPALVGRGSACDLRLDHPSVEPAHALVEPGWTICALDGTVLVDGRPIGGPVPLTGTVSIGAVDLQLLEDRPPTIVPPPHAPVHRSARVPEPPVVDPEPPAVADPPSPPGPVTLLAPVAVGLVLAVAVHPTAGLMGASVPLLTLGSWLDGRRRHRRDRRRADAAHAAALADVEDRRAAAARRRFPSPVDALVRSRTGTDLWVGPSDVLDTVGVAGPRPWAEAAARAVVLQSVVLAGPNDRSVARTGPWRWLPHAGAVPVRVEVADTVEGLSDRCDAWLAWTPDGALRSDRDGRRDEPVRPFVASEELAERAGRLLARWSDPTDGVVLPDLVRLSELVDPADEDGRRSLACPLGVGADGPVVVDLVADGPHALVAGTTGSGKSELLRSWVTGMARRHPPTALAFVLVDYKGGSAFDACAALPHVTGVVTDLDPGLGERLLVSLRAEVREREAVLRAAGVGDLRDLGDGPPRLVVVVDEFATLADELPDVLAALVDLARRGRSLGLHLVLATQRPAGVVSDDIRANTALRLCLRTLDPADAVDVLGVAVAPPADRPGRAWLRRGGEPELVQVATTGLLPPEDEPPITLRPWPSSTGS